MARRAAPRGRPFRRGSGSLVWIENVATGRRTVAAGATDLHSLFTFDDLTEQVVRRTRGQVIAEMATFSASTETATCAFGIGILPRTPTPTAATIPGPLTEASWDGWFVHGMIVLSAPVLFTLTGSQSYQRTEIDSKGMRRVNQDDIIFVAFENASFSDVTVAYHLAFRQLLAPKAQG